MQSILILQRQLWLLLMVLLSMITARSPLEMLASSVRAVQQMTREKQLDELATTTSSVVPYIPREQAPVRQVLPSAFILLSPVWESTETSASDSNRRHDLNVAESNSAGKVQQIMLTWPAELALPSHKIPLRFIATMAVPISTLTSDPLLTKGELSEVVYYSNMDLRKINITGREKLLFHAPNHADIHAEDSSEEEEDASTESYEDDDSMKVNPYFTIPESSTLRTSTHRNILPTQIAAIPISDASDEERQRRSWPHERGSSSRAISRDHHYILDWMDGESVAYIAVGTCCGISVLTLAIVLLVLRLRGSTRRRGHLSSIDGSETTSDNKHHYHHHDCSSLDSYQSDDSTAITLPEKLLNLLNSHSQEVSTHKLGSWFNGKPSTLSMRHGTNMAFPAPIRRFQVTDNLDEINNVPIGEQPTAVVTTADDFISTEFAMALAEEETRSDVQCDRGNTTSMEGTLEDVDSRDASVADSKHDTFIFWSTNSDRLV